MNARIALLLLVPLFHACTGDEPPTAPTAPVEPESATSLQAQAETVAIADGENPIPDTPTGLEAENDRQAIQRRYQAGAHYELIQPPQQPSTTDAIEVLEIFQYSCPGCFSFEPYLERWNESKAGDVRLVRLPAVWNQLGELHARAFYTAEAVGKLDEIHAPFFREFHVNGNFLDTENKLRDFFGRFGIDAETFDSTFDSFAVHTKLQRARELVTRYRVPQTPSIVVHGKYLTTGTLAGSYEDWFEIIDELTSVERVSE